MSSRRGENKYFTDKNIAYHRASVEKVAEDLLHYKKYEKKHPCIEIRLEWIPKSHQDGGFSEAIPAIPLTRSVCLHSRTALPRRG